ncbi:MAG: transglutaminase-like domain-containing protein [Bacteroidia bacterium]
MKNRHQFLAYLLFLFISSCVIYIPNKTVPYSKTITSFNNSNGIVSETDVIEGLDLQGKHPENTEFITDLNVKLFKFGYFAENVKNGNPVYVTEDCYEKYIATKDFVQFRKLEYFNDQITFKGFNVKLGSNKSTKLTKKDYVITNFQSGGIFYSDAKQAQISHNINVVGTHLSINYSRLYKDAKYLTSVYFLDDFPQKEQVVSFEIPSYLNIEIIEKNLNGFSIEKTITKYDLDDADFKPFLNKERTSDKVTYITYKIKNTIALKNERYKPGYSHNVPHLVILVKSVNEKIAKNFSKAPPKDDKITIAEKKETDKIKKSKKTPSTFKKSNTKNKVYKTVPLIANTNDLYAHYSQIVSQVENDSTVFANKLKQIVLNKLTDIEKIEAVFYWVQDNIRYVAFEDGIAGFKPDACQNVFNNKYGDCKGMANLLKSMLTSLGYDARLTWIGTKHLNYDYSIPSILVDNHMICTVILNEKKYYLDGTEGFISIDDYADRIQGRQVMVQNGDNYFIDTIPDLPIERNLHLRKATFTLNDNIFDGQLVETIKGESKTNILRNFYNTNTNKKGTFLQDEVIDQNDVDIDASNIKSTNLNDRKNDLTISYDLIVSNHLISTNDVIMLKPDFNREFYNSKADSGRFFDLQFNHKINYEYDFKFEIPRGYKKVYKPENLIIKNEEFEIQLIYEIVDNYISYKKNILIKNGRITKSNFGKWNSAIDKLRNNYNQYVKLTK